MKNKSKEELLQVIKSLEEKLSAKDRIIAKLRDESEAKNSPSYELLMDSGMPYQSLDKDGNFIEVNKAWCDYLGFEKQEIIGKNFTYILEQSIRQVFAEKFEDFKKNGLMVEEEVELLRQNGTIATALIEGRAVYDNNNNFAYTHCILKDTTDKKRLAVEKARQKALFENTFKNLPIGVAHLRRDGTVIRCNPKYASILGTEVEHLLNKSIWDFDLNLETSENDQIQFEKVANKEQSIYEVEKQKKKADGSVIWIKAIVSPIFDNDGKFDYFIGVIEDISERKEQENSLHLFKSIIENTNYGVAVCSMDKRVLYSNHSFAKMHMTTTEDTIGKKIDIYHSDSQLGDAHKAFESMTEDHLHTPRLVWHVKSNGEEFPMLMNGGIVEGASGEKYVTASAIDITELYFQNKELEESKAKYYSLISQTPDCIYIAELESLKIIEANNALLDLTGYTFDEITSITLHDLIDIPNSDIEEKIALLKKYSTLKLDLRYYLTKSGKRIPVETNSSLIRVDNIVYISTIARDIRERIKIEDELRERENFVRSITDNVPVIIFVYDPDLREAIYVNNQLSLQLGYDHTEITLSDKNLFRQIVHKDDFDIFQKILTHSDSNSNYVEFRLKHKTGGYRWFGSTNTRISIFRDESYQILGFVQSIDDKKRYSKALLESERMYKSLAESLPDTIMRFDRGLRHLYVSENVAKVIDLNASDMINKTHEDLGFPKDLTDFWARHINHVFNTGEAVETEFTMNYSDGVAVIDWRLMPEYNDQGDIVSVLAIARQINDLRDTERDYQRLFNEMTSGFAVHEIILDDEGKPCDYKFIVVNKAFEKMTGLKSEKVKGKRIKDILPATEDYWIDIYGKVALTGETITFENYSQELDRYYEVTAYSPLKYQFATIIDDITKEKKIQNVIKEQEEKYRIIVENQSDFLVKLDSNYHIIYSNPRFNQALEKEETDLLGKNFFEVIPQEHRPCFISLFHDFKNKDKDFATKECKHSASGRWINWTIKSVTHDNEEIEYYVAVGHDITEIKAVQAQIEKLNSELEEKVIQRTMQLQNVVTQLKEENEQHKKTKMQLEVAKSQIEKALIEEKELNQMKTRFISMVSHEYRTPLTVILSSSFLIDRFIKNGETAKISMHLEKIQAGVKQMTNLLEDVIAVGKSEEGVLLPNLQYFDLSSQINTIVDEIYSIDSRMHKIVLDFNLANEIIYSDPKMIRQILNNLLTNACKYSNIGTEIKVKIHEKDMHLVIEVSDQGMGISEDDLEQLFTPFFRNKQHIGAIPGSGLGLTIVKKSINALEGLLKVHSKLNAGSTFSVSFPLSKVYPDFYKD